MKSRDAQFSHAAWYLEFCTKFCGVHQGENFTLDLTAFLRDF